MTLGQWNSSPAEKSALASALAAYSVSGTKVTVNQETIAGDYRAEMITRFGAHNPPDLFYVNAEYAQAWADQGFLYALDDFIARDKIDTSKFFQNYLNIFKGSNGKIYGLPKDGNTIALAYNTDLVTTAPATLDALVATATSLKGTGKLTAPMCLSPSLDRALVFIYAQGGSLLTADGKAEAISTDASKNAVQWYLNLFKDGLGLPQPANSWCGEQIGNGNVAMVFEGGWLKGYVEQTFPDTKWTFAEVPTGSSGNKVTISFTASYAIGADSANKEQAWDAMKYLTGPAGMAVWTGGGIAVPSRSDVPVPAGFDVIVNGAAYAKPGSGFMKGFGDTQTAFNNAFLLEVQNGTYNAQAVVDATKAAITTALAQ
jgi:multiple sugar transport system substrate-binding protein